MKPNFALSLSFDGIMLLHRAAGGWREVGDVPLSSEDLGAELAMLRKTAAQLEPGGVRAKLLIPASQIKYLTIDTPGLSEGARRKAAEAALDHATPYDIADLAYDISMDGPRTHIAAVARKTLAEAEAFAHEHRFHPVSFVAVPGDAPYLGEPFFGATKAAADLLEAGETVEPDGIAVVIVGAIVPDRTPEPTPDPKPKITPAQPVRFSTDAPVAPQPVAPQTTAAPEKPAAPPAKETAPRDTQARAPAPETTQDAAPKQTAAAQAVPVVPGPAKGEKVKITVDLPAPGNPVPPQVSRPAPKLLADAPAASIRATDPAPGPSPGVAIVAPVVQPPAGAAAAAPLRAATQDTEAPAPRVAATGFSTRRNGTTSAARPLGGANRSAITTPQPDSSSLTQPPPPTDPPAAALPPEKVGFLSRRKAPAAAQMKAPVPAAPAGSETERMTVFGARADQIGGKPRFLGLVMTVILLVFLAGVAAWAAVFLDDGIAGLLRKDASRATASAPENQIDPEIIRTPDGVAEAQSGAPDGVQIAALDPVLSASDSALPDARQPPELPGLPVITQAEAAARYAVTGIWPLAPETALSKPEVGPEPVYHSSIDPASSASDAIALTAPQTFDTDIQMAALVPPPPFGQKTQVDAAGLTVPTQTGVVAPGGFTLFAASPPLKPPATLVRFAAQPTVTAPAVISPLAGARPRNRPQGLSETTERAQLGGVLRSELAAYRPALRPQSLQERAREQNDAARQAEEAAAQTEQARAAAAAAASAAATAALAVPGPAIEAAVTAAAAVAPAVSDATQFATAQSRRPDTRPRNFARIVRRAASAAPEKTTAPEEETRVAAAAQVAPRTVAPSLPSKASVARSATVPNAINLRKVNLIGVYGKPSSRRALVRLSNGRYQKVSVGDRIDGGRVSAIGNSDLRYTKGGRNVVLTMP
jgi:hypothetical protein